MNDLEFVRRCTKGDKQTLAEFVDKYSRLIYSYIHKVFEIKGANQLNQDHINDLFHEIFVSLLKDNFKKLRSFKAKNGCSLASWLKAVVVNFTIDYIRRYNPVLSLDEETDDKFSLKDILIDNSGSVLDKLSIEERVTHLKDCIQELDTDDKYFLELHLNRGMELKELKKIFRLSRPAIDMRKSRIINRLRDCFKSKGFALDL